MLKAVGQCAAVFFGVLAALCFLATMFLTATGVWAGILIYGPLTVLFWYMAASISVEANGSEATWS